MFAKKTDNELGLEKEINDLLAVMHETAKVTDQYANMVDQLQKLCALKEDKSKSRVSADTLAIVGGNLAGILTIVLAEKSSVITSVAKGFILKAR